MATRRRSSPPTWYERTQVLTHILTHPTTAPSLHSQLFVSAHIPCFLRWDYPPFLCPSPSLLRWSLSLFLRRLRPHPPASWRSTCPFQQPPPVVLSAAVGMAPARWSSEERRAWVRRRLRRGQLGIRLHPFFAVVVPNMMLLLLLLWNPFWFRREPREW